MNTGKTLFAQLMDFLPWTTFTRYVNRYGGDRYVKTLPCAEQYRAMAFAQLTYRESLRDIETCLVAQDAKLYHMGFREPVRRSTLADANETRDWRIYADLGEVESGGPSGLLRSGRSLDRADLRSDHRTRRLLFQAGLPRPPAANSFQRSGNRQNAHLPYQRDDLACADHLRALQEPLAGRIVLQVDQAASSDQEISGHFGKCGQDANLDRGVGLRARRHRQETPQPRRFALFAATDLVGHAFRKNAFASSTSAKRHYLISSRLS